MKNSSVTFLTAFALGIAAAGVHLEAAPPAAKPSPAVTGQWTGIWWPHPSGPTAPKLNDKDCARLGCTVVQKDNAWQATFEGECSRQYTFTVTMEGRRAGEAVLFKGTTDLGENNGGVFDWIGRADGKEFVGFFTSATHVGEFRLTRKE